MDTVVGDQQLKGISGGQRRRVTSAELAVGLAQCMFWDEISTGLDSATTFQMVQVCARARTVTRGAPWRETARTNSVLCVVRTRAVACTQALRNLCVHMNVSARGSLPVALRAHALAGPARDRTCVPLFSSRAQGTYVISLLQPSPETFALFDDVMVMAGRRIVFHGPRDEVLPFFEGLGFRCPPNKTVADFLQEVVTSTDQHVSPPTRQAMRCTRRRRAAGSGRNRAVA